MPNRSPSRITRLALAVSFALPLAAAPATHAQVIYPGPNPCDGTLQACIDATPAGETVRIATNGPIAESISFEKSLTLEAADGFVPIFSAGASIFAGTPVTGSHFIRIAGLHLEGGVISIGQNSTGSLGAEITGCRAAASGYSPAIAIRSGNVGPLRGPVFFAIEGNEASIQGGGSEAYGIALQLNDYADATGVIRDNVVIANDIGQGGVIDVSNGHRVIQVSVIRNRISGANYNSGILLYQYASGSITATVAGNEVSAQPGSQNGPAAIEVNGSGENAQVSVDIVNNTVVDSRTGIQVSGRTDLGAVVTGEIANNLIAGNERGFSIEPSIAASMPDRNNLFFDNVSNFSDEEGDPFVPGPGTVFGDPLFAGPTDFSILPGSAAQDAGDSTALPVVYNVDLAGKVRVQGAAVDIGAYEVPEPGGALAGAAALAGLAAIRARRARR